MLDKLRAEIGSLRSAGNSRLYDCVTNPLPYLQVPIELQQHPTVFSVAIPGVTVTFSRNTESLLPR